MQRLLPLDNANVAFNLKDNCQREYSELVLFSSILLLYIIQCTIYSYTAQVRLDQTV